MHENINNNENVVAKPKVTFKDGIKALFDKIFLFKGKSSRSEFNYGLLFLFLVGFGISIIMSMSLISQIDIEDPNATNNLIDLLLTSDFYMVFSLLYSLAFALFLSAPIYRRMCDFKVSEKAAIWLMLLFVTGQIISNVYYLDLGEDVLNSVSIFVDLFSITSTVLLIFCMCKKSKN